MQCTVSIRIEETEWNTMHSSTCCGVNFLITYFQISRVWIESPSQVRLAQWLDVGTQQGLAQLSFQLSHEPPQVMGNISIKLFINMYLPSISTIYIYNIFVMCCYMCETFVCVKNYKHDTGAKLQCNICQIYCNANLNFA
jgi:hypothetical protein